MISCPFCGDDDFDLIGLKYHLQNYCDEFEKTPKPLPHKDQYFERALADNVRYSRNTLKAAGWTDEEIEKYSVEADPP